jgi:import receptor subunit TOM22
MDETVVERLIGLSEMFPERLQKVFSGAVSLTWSGSKRAYSYGRVAVWVLASSFAILALPVLFESERAQMEEQQIQQQRQVCKLLGCISYLEIRMQATSAL